MRFPVINVDSLEIKSKHNEITTSFRISHPTLTDDLILRDVKDFQIFYFTESVIPFEAIEPGYS